MATAEWQNPEKIPAAELLENSRSSRVLVPQADIYESEQEIILLVDIPGADEGSVAINIEKNVLFIQAPAEMPEPEGHSLRYSEYETGNYQRKFVLPENLDHGAITACMKNGVLKLVLPKSATARTKKIEVKAES